MSETTNSDLNFFDECIASVWAVMPEEMVNTIAGVKKDLLLGLRSTIDSMVDNDINAIDRHLANSCRLREEWKQKSAASETEAAQS